MASACRYAHAQPCSHDFNLQDAQKGRVKVLAAWAAARKNSKKPFAEKKKLLREVLVMLFHTVQPPDR